MPIDGKTREDAWALVTEYTDSENLINHMLAVEAAMRGYARMFDENEEEWGILGLVHDFDYEKHQGENGHPFVGVQVLDKKGWPRDFRRAVLSHADYTGVPRESKMEKALYACDELCGFLVACVLVRPSKSFSDLSVKSVKKKLKDDSFAAGVSREHIESGAEDLGIPLDEHIENVISFLEPIEEELGLGAAYKEKETAES
ncbi:MAG: HD domain-containing protein [Gemmatimonadota bacterium]|nr:HD domain-containing protein [Gemmatimonadota bacterium]